MRAPLLLGLLLAPCLAAGQGAADPDSEPHYHLLLENSAVRVFQMTLHPDESALVLLQRSFLTVALQDGEIIMWDEGKSPIQHFQMHMGETSFRCWSTVCLNPEQLAKGLSGGYRNDRQKDYRNITVEFLDPAIGWNMPEGGLLGPPGSMFIGGAIVADVLLQAGDSFPAPDKAGAELVIPLSDVELKGAHRLRIHASSGDVAWIQADQVSSLANAGRDPARFIVVQFHPDTPFVPVTQRR
jgi:hypothetical protein